MSEPFIGQITAFGGSFAPRGWAFCDGQLLPIVGNEALFSLLGTIYGGDGRSTFGLPDLRGRSMVHQGAGPGLSTYRLGQKGGTEVNTITTANMPSHNHNLTSEFLPADQGGSTGNSLAQTPNNPSYTNPRGRANRDLASDAISNTGGGQSINNLSPYLAVSVIIALVGVYPSRS